MKSKTSLWSWVRLVSSRSYQPRARSAVQRIDSLTSTTPWAVGYLFYGAIALGLLIAAGRTPEPVPDTT